RIAAGLARGPVVGDLAEAVVADALEQRFAVGEVAVDRHRRDADRFGHAAHAHRVRSLALEQPTGGGEDAPGGVVAIHVYTVYFRHRRGAIPRCPGSPGSRRRLFGWRGRQPRRTLSCHPPKPPETPWAARATTPPAGSAPRAAAPCSAAAG